MNRSRMAGFVFVVLLLVPSAFAVDSGKASGKVIINRKPVIMKYAFAKKDKDFDEKDRWVVILTDRAVSRSLLGDDSRLRKAVENGEVVAALITFNADKKVEQAEVKSKALQHGSLPMGGTGLSITGLIFGADFIEAGVATTEDETFFTDVATMDVKFRASIGNNKFGDNPLAAADLAGSAPKIADGAAVGSLKLDGSTVKLSHAIARSKPGTFDEKKRDVILLLSDQPVTAETFIDHSKLYDAVRNGKVRGMIVTINEQETPVHLELLHPESSLQVSGSGIFNFDAVDFSDKRVTGRFYTTSQQEMMDHKYSYDVSFAVPVQKIAPPGEDTVDASNGTKLPPNGGEPGKAYMAFDKAARTGNLKELKKYGSKDRQPPEMSNEEMKEILELIKMMRPDKFKITGGFVNGDRATLHIEREEADKSKMKGTVEMVREDRVWKILGEKWKGF